MPGLAYLDSSAMAKLLMPERESNALEAAILDKDGLVSSRLSIAECGRALMRAGREPSGDAVEDVLGAFVLVDVSATLLQDAACLAPALLRALDAIHVATALSLADPDVAFITYDRRMAEAARAHGLTVVQPGRPG
ncbi:MAG: type II toxin-antitoxin system VapC family toxin [Acidobacteriota bacterium]|nr:type II toxin-antitoxin system VapC family toxin [Acidobacteriota bacterium]